MTPREELTTIDVPAPTAWPLVLAAGCTLVFAGLLTNVSVTALGVVLTLAGCGRKGPLDLPPTASSPVASAAPAPSDTAPEAASKPSLFNPSYGTDAAPVLGQMEAASRALLAIPAPAAPAAPAAPRP